MICISILFSSFFFLSLKDYRFVNYDIEDLCVGKLDRGRKTRAKAESDDHVISSALHQVVLINRDEVLGVICL